MSFRHPLGLRIISIFKLISAVLLAGVGFGIFQWLSQSVADDISYITRVLRLDPQRREIHELLAKITGINPKTLRAIGAATFVYSALYVIEGIGLWKEKRWAEYLTAIITGSLIPFEAYEIARHPDLLRLGVLSVNLIILIYLLRQLRRTH